MKVIVRRVGYPEPVFAGEARSVSFGSIVGPAVRVCDIEQQLDGTLEVLVWTKVECEYREQYDNLLLTGVEQHCVAPVGLA